MSATPVNANLWNTYLTRRGVKAEVAAKLIAGQEVKVKNGVESNDKDAVTVTLSNGLDLKEEAGLGINRTEDDARMAAGWNVERKEDQTGDAANIIDENELAKHEETIKQYADAHGIDPEEAAKLYRAKSLGTENFTEVKAKREKAEQDTQKDYNEWKAKNNNGTFAQYLVAKGVPSTSWIHHLGFGNQSPQGFVHAVFSSSFPLDARKSAYNTDDPAPGYNYDSYGYDAGKMMGWATGKQPAQAAQAGAAAAQTPADTSGTQKPAAPQYPKPPKVGKGKDDMQPTGQEKYVSIKPEGSAQYPIFTHHGERYANVDGKYYKVDENDDRTKEKGSDIVAVSSTPTFDENGLDSAAAATPPAIPPSHSRTDKDQSQTGTGPLPAPPRWEREQDLGNGIKIFIYKDKQFMKQGSGYYEVRKNAQNTYDMAERPTYEDPASSGPPVGGTNLMPQVGYQPGNRTNVPGYRLTGQ